MLGKNTIDLHPYKNTKEYMIFLAIIFMIMPVFIGQNGERLVFDSSYRSHWKALPIGIALCLPLIAVTFVNNLSNNYKILLLLAISSLVSWLVGSDVRTLIVFFQIVFLISFVEGIDWFCKTRHVNWESIQKYLFFAIFIVVLLKFYTDVYYYFDYYVYKLSGILDYPKEEYRNIASLYQNIFSNPLFISNNILIYSYFDYFQVVYIAGLIFGFRNIKTYPLISVLLIAIVITYLFHSTSRMWQVVALVMPVLWLLSKSRLNFDVYFILFLLGSVAMIAFSGVFLNEIDMGYSLNFRANLIHGFFNDMNFVTFIFPIINNNFNAATSSMHNELLEIWYRTGLMSLLAIIIWLYIKLRFVFLNDKFISLFLLFLFFFGGLIQMNYLHFYSSMMLALIMSGAMQVNKNS